MVPNCLRHSGTDPELPGHFGAINVFLIYLGAEMLQTESSSY